MNGTNQDLRATSASTTSAPIPASPPPAPPRRLPDWLPQSILALAEGYGLRTFAQDAIAGLTVGLVALPLAMAFAIASGLTPQAGIYCAIITGFLISALGGSRFQVGGPTGAFVVVISGIVAQYGVDGLFMCTMMAGLMLLVMGLTGTGSAVKYIPRPVIVGFTNGIALVIASTQFKDFLGLTIDVPGEFLGRMEVIAAHLSEVSWPSIGLGSASLAAIILCNRYLPRVPGYIVALFGGTAVALVANLDVATIGSRFGGIPAGLPEFHVPQFRPALILSLLSPAVTVAMLGAIESLLSAVVADRMGGDRHNPNTELVAQGVANIVSPLFGGLPATGAIARTATNIRSGAQTPVAGMLHAVTLLVVLLFAAPLAAHVPLPVLAAILFVVARNMGEWAEIPELLKHGYTDVAVWLVTFALTVLADLTVAVEVGMVLAALLFIHRVAQTTTVSRVTPDYIDAGRRARPAGQGDSRWRRDLPHPRAVPVRRDRQAAGHRARRRVAAAGGAAAPSQHDRRRRDRAGGDRRTGRHAARLWTDVDRVRRAGAAGGADAPRGVRGPPRRGQHLPERGRCAAARAGAADAAAPGRAKIGLALDGARVHHDAHPAHGLEAQLVTGDRHQHEDVVGVVSRGHFDGPASQPARAELAARPGDELLDAVAGMQPFVEVLVAGEDHFHPERAEDGLECRAQHQRRAVAQA